MPDKPDEEIRKSIKRFEESLPESEPAKQGSALTKLNVRLCIQRSVKTCGSMVQ